MFAGGAGGEGGNALYAALYYGGIGGAGGAGGDALCATLYAGDCGGFVYWRMSEVEVPEVMRRVLLCMLEAVEGAFCLLAVLEVMRLCCFVCWKLRIVGSVCWRC